MDAILNIKPSEFNEDLLKKLKKLLKGSNFDITIHVTNDPKTKFLRKESREEYFERIEKAIQGVKNRKNTIEFTTDQFDAFSSALLRTAKK